jgi:3-oxoacyl-[acyl-carrier protein] reductase
MSLELAGRVAVVTGASRGIGRATALALARHGAGVLAVSRNGEALASLAAEPIASPGWIRGLATDLRDRAAAAGVVSSVEREFGKLDILVNNAGWEIHKALELQSDSDYDATVETNLGAPFVLIRAAIPGMKQRRSGWIVNVASVTGLRGFRESALYSATKFAIVGLTDSLEEELRDAGIHVSAICPGWVNTDLAGDAGLADDRYRPLLLQPEDVADAIAFVVCQPDRVAISRIVLRPQVETPYSGLLPLDTMEPRS